MKINLKKPNIVDEKNKLDNHKLSLKELAIKFHVSLTDGLDENSARMALLKNGKNKLTQKKTNPLLKVLSYFFSGFCGLIWIAAIICILAWKPIGNPSDPTNLGLGIMLIFVILVQAAFTAFQDFTSNKVMKSIKNMMPSNATVLRNNVEKKIPVEELVVGDLVILSYGTKVPADIRLIESHGIKFDKSMLTGESEDIEGTVECTDERYVESKNIAYMTTLITNGQGRGIVIETGDRTLMGSIASLTNKSVEKKSTLQIELRRFVAIIAGAAIIMAVIVVIVWATWLRVQYPNYMDVPSLLVNTISVMVAFIPEGLPVCVTLALLLIAKRMAKSNVLVKELSTIETLSCVNVIASDCSSLCNNAHFDESDKTTTLVSRKANGDATDIALLKFSTKYQMNSKSNDKFKIMAEIPFNSKNKWMMKIVRPEKQEQCTLFKTNTDIMLLKGAPDYLLKKCRKIMNANGDEEQMTAQHVTDLIKLQNDWCLLGQRVLLICKKNLDYSMPEDTALLCLETELEAMVEKSNDFCIVGLVGIIDPPREGITDVITKCRTAGIRVFMVTGDYALTAAAIASQIGIFTGNQYDTAESMRIKHKVNHEPYEKSALLLTGADLEYFNAEDWRLVTPYSEIVFARTTPEQKLRIVQEFQHDNYVVGVTGDGVNDAPALKCADIGIAMGGGSEVAMEAAQLVLLDNNFSSILVAIKNGRLVFANLRKVILYLLPGGCMAELIPMLIMIFLGVPQNLSSFQMLIISLFTDIAPSLSLIMEKPEKDLLTQPPRSKYDHIVDWKFLIQAYLFLGSIICVSSQFMFFWYMQWYAKFTPGDILFSFGVWADGFKHLTSDQITEYFNVGQTVTFISIVYLQIFGNLMSTRTNNKSLFDHAPWIKRTRNIWLFVAQFISVSIMLLIVFLPFSNQVLNTRVPPVQFFFLPLIFCELVICFDELRKFLARKQLLGFHKFSW